MNPPIIVLVLIGLNALISWQGFKNPAFFEKYSFQPFPILQSKEYVRMISSGFLHANITHILFNMIAFWSFSYGIYYNFFDLGLLLIYFVSLLGGNFLSLWMHKNNEFYKAVGASGAVSGIVFAAVYLDPNLNLLLLFIPMKGWIFAVLFVLFSIYGMRTNYGNLGHEAHLGGALSGLVCAILLKPELLQHNYKIVALIAIPALLGILLSNRIKANS